MPFPEGQQELVLKVHKGDTTRIIVREMQSEGLDVHPDISALAFKLLDADKNIHVGRYLIPKGWTLNEIIAHLKSGKVIMSKITFIEGTETKKIVDKVNSDTNLEQNSEPITMENVMKVVGAPEKIHIPKVSLRQIHLYLPPALLLILFLNNLITNSKRDSKSLELSRSFHCGKESL